MNVQIPYDRYVHLVTDSGILNNMRANQLPELRLAMVIIIILLAYIILLGLFLRWSEQQGKDWQRMVDEMHAEDRKKLEIDPVSHTELEQNNG